MTDRLYIVAMRHHDFKSELSTLFQRIEGCTVILRKEDDNAHDPGMAVAVYFENRLLGYVTSNKMKARVRMIIELSGRPFVKCSISRVVRSTRVGQSDMLEALLPAKPDATPGEAYIMTKPERQSDWSHYRWDGLMLNRQKEENQLHAVVDELYFALVDGDPWTEQMQACIDAICRLSWADQSKDIQERYDTILRLLTADKSTEKHVASDCLQQVISHVGSPEVREQVYHNMVVRAQSAEVSEIIEKGGYSLDMIREMIPQKLYQLLAANPQKFVERLWYLKMPRDVWHGIMSATTILVRCMLDADKRLADQRLPIAERTMKVGDMMAWGSDLPTDMAHEMCRLIMLHNPMLNNDDIMALNNAFNVNLPMGGVVFNQCELTGNNITEHLSTLTMPELPHTEMKQLTNQKERNGIQQLQVR